MPTTPSITNVTTHALKATEDLGRFGTKAFVDDPPDIAADCHCLQKVDVLAILRQHEMTLLDFYDDFLTECYGSIIYFARKDA